MGKALCRAHGTSVWAALWHASADCTLSELLRSRGNMDRWAREGAGGDLPEGGRSAGWGNGGGLGRWQRNSVVHLCRRHGRSEEHTSELQSLAYLVCRLLLEKKKKKKHIII